jgi:hypothetical protein
VSVTVSVRRPPVPSAGPLLHRPHLSLDALAWGVGWAVVLFGLAVWWGTRVFKKENA